ncbi:hypothetical protein AB1Y20_023116 [Prymnesium parvum]|uniref:SWIRM domain-containing protein n=1 Tax=Prymnesium parvum TaxID=97485 RepID=A0AB34JF88_PRYPA
MQAALERGIRPQALDAISAELRAQLGEDAPCASAQLAALAQSVLRFSRDTLGPQSDAPREQVRLPARLFFDVRREGSLRVILESCCRLLAAEHSPALRFDEAPRSSQLAMLAAANDELVRRGLLQWPRVHLSGTLEPGEAARLEALITSKRGSLVSAAEEATHVVLCGTPPGSARLRAVRTDEDGVLEHTPFTPDSCDRWVEAASAASHAPADADPTPNRWWLSDAWLRDLSHWNEWMNEADYEVRQEGGEAQTKRARRRAADDETDLSNGDRKLQRGDSARVRRSSPVPQQIPMPSHAAWFRLDAVHEIERGALPEFFDGSARLKTEETYVQARNFIVGTYREQPTLPITVTECRRHIALDVGAVMRLHQFLEHWGIINYCSVKLAGMQVRHAATVAGVSLEGPAASSVATHMLTLPAGTNLSLRHERFPADAAAEEWSEQDTLALLEGLEKYEDRWEDVATYVGKPAAQCVRQFLRLPIEEPYAATPPETTRRANEPPADAMLCQLALLAAAVSPPTAGEGSTAADGAAVAKAASEAADSLRTSANECLESIRTASQVAERAEKASINELVARVVDTQLKRVELKMRQLDELTSFVRQESAQLERMRHQVFAERMSFEKRRIQHAAGLPTSAGYHAVFVGGLVPGAADVAGSSQPLR